MYNKIALIICTSAFVACAKQNVSSSTIVAGNSVVITDLAGDTAAAAKTDDLSNTGIVDFQALYFNFTTQEKVAISDSSQQADAWDLAFTGPFNAEIYVNRGAIIQVDSAYDQVTTAPSDAAFGASPITKIGWDAGNGTGWFFYSLSNHICVPIKDRTFVLRTASGKYAKLQIVNVYKGNPPVVTNLFWPAPYFTFRYFIQQDGSHLLKT